MLTIGGAVDSRQGQEITPPEGETQHKKLGEKEAGSSQYVLTLGGESTITTQAR